MKLEDQVCGLDLAKRLEALGVKRESLAHWQHHRSVNSPGGWAWSLSNMPNSKSVAAFTVAELGEMLPDKIDEKTINAAYPMPDLPGHVDGDEWERIEILREAVREKLQDFLCSFEGDTDQFEDGMPYDIRLSFNDGKEVSYHQLTDDWANNCPVIEMRGETEADARAKMLIYLIENKLFAVENKS
jgi:hypothetical protein